MDEQDATPTNVGSNDQLGAWAPVAQRLPDFDVPVWLYESGIVYIGCRIDDSDGWLWARCYGMPYVNARGVWTVLDAEAEDDHPTLWQPLPDVPRYTQAELDAAIAEAGRLQAVIRVVAS